MFSEVQDNDKHTRPVVDSRVPETPPVIQKRPVSLPVKGAASGGFCAGRSGRWIQSFDGRRNPASTLKAGPKVPQEREGGHYQPNDA